MPEEESLEERRRELAEQVEHLIQSEVELRTDWAHAHVPAFQRAYDYTYEELGLVQRKLRAARQEGLTVTVHGLEVAAHHLNNVLESIATLAKRKKLQLREGAEDA